MVLLACGGCGLTLDLEPPKDGGSGTDFAMTRPDLGLADLAVPDATTRPDLGDDLGSGDDGGPDEDATVCVALVELCNGLDDDCDDVVDEDYDLSSDLENCGACGRACEGRGGEPDCEAGRCLLTCDPGRQDCDDDPSNGCETDLSAPETCGDCDSSCPAGAPRCIANGSIFSCVVECGVDQTLCDGSCVDLNTSPSHCGACGSPCFLDPHGSLECRSGRCVVADCGDNHADCNDDPVDGCEQSLNTADHCGSCDTPCGATDGVCVAGLCTAMTPGG